MLQRCALARALLHRPEVLILDEPFTGLDLEAVSVLHDVLTHAHREGTTLLMSTHDLTQGLSLCAHALVLVGGRVAFHGAIAATEHAAFAAQYRCLVQPRGANA
jgi:ABC-type multidrug transport system ATPase subunit